MIELSITIRDENSKLVEKDTYFEPILLDPQSPFLKQEIDKALKKFNRDPNAEAPAIIIKAKLVIQS